VRPSALRNALWAAIFLCGFTRVPAHAEPHPAAVALYEGRLDDVLSLAPPGETDPELAYLAARALAGLGRYAEADARLPPSLPASWPKAVQDDVRVLRARWAAEAGRVCELPEADAALLGKPKTLVLARCAFVAGEHGRAEKLLKDEKGAEARALFVRVLARLDKRKEAREVLRKLYLEAPELDAHDELLGLLELTPESLELNADERMTRTEELIRAIQPERAIDELTGLGKQRERLAEARRLHLLGEAQFRTREHYPESSKSFTQAAKLRGPTEAYDAFHAVRATARAGDNASAIRGFAAFAKKYPKDELATDALYLQAWLSLREHRANALTLLGRFVQSEGAKRQRGLLRSGTWDLAWAYFSGKRASEAQSWFSRYAEIADSDLERARGHYWAGRAAALAKRPADAEAAYGRAITADGLGYYALLAVRALEGDKKPVPPPFPRADKAPPEPKLTAPPEVLFYAGLLLTDDAVCAAGPWLKSLATPRERARGALFTADADRSFTQAAPLMDDAIAEGPRTSGWLWGGLFPRPYESLVEAATAREELPIELFYGHMQVESRYRPAVVSSADAIGLMQLLPTTATRVGEPLGIRVTRTSLTRPAINITLGASYLGGLVRRYGGQEPLAIAAYNAGTERVDEWIRRMGKVELARWVEEIPVEQTRNYVRRVVTAWARYRAHHAPDEAWALPLSLTLSPPARGAAAKSGRVRPAR
jgi:soluble lytic murein transglycosylase